MIRKPGWVRVSGTAGLSVTISVAPGCNSSYTNRENCAGGWTRSALCSRTLTMITIGPLGARSGCQVNSPGLSVAASRTCWLAAGVAAEWCATTAAACLWL